MLRSNPSLPASVLGGAGRESANDSSLSSVSSSSNGFFMSSSSSSNGVKTSYEKVRIFSSDYLSLILLPFLTKLPTGSLALVSLLGFGS